MKRLFLLIVLSVFIFCAKNMLFAAVEDHPMMKPVPGSIATNNWKGYYEMYVVEEKAFNKRMADVTQETKQQMTAGSANTARTVQTAKATEFPSMLKEAETAYLSGNKLETVEKLKQAVLYIWDEVPLTVKNIKIVEDTSTYVPRKSNIFRVGEKIHINAQLFGYRFKQTGGAYSIKITTDVYFIKDGEVLAGQQDFGNFEITSPISNTEFRLDLTYWLSEAPPAIYDVQTVVHDRNSGQSTKFTIQIELQ